MKPLTMALALLAGALLVWVIVPRKRTWTAGAKPDLTDMMGDYGAYPVARLGEYVH